MHPYEVVARNLAPESENKIHEDDVARRYGFAGGLVPGVVVHAYLAHPPAEQWGPAWVEGGGLHARFQRPVYDGEAITIDPLEGGGLAVHNPSGDAAAVAEVYPPGVGPAEVYAPGVGPPGVGPAVDLARWPHLPLPAREQRPPASAEAFAAHPILGALDAYYRHALGELYLDAISEPLPLFREEGVAHPGWLIAQANYVLAANVALGPWIHVESDVRHLGLVHDGDLVSTRAIVVGTSERKGHRFVELDVLIVDGAERPILRARHVAIYEPRRRDPGT